MFRMPTRQTMQHRWALVFAVLGSMTPGCVLPEVFYDEDIAPVTGGGYPGGTGGQVAGGGGSGGGGEAAGGGAGGAPVTPSGGSSTGGAPGGGTGGEPASGGTGGSDVCEGEVGEFTDVDLDTLELIDDFNTNWPVLTNDTANWDGSWTTNFEPALETTLVPQADGLIQWLDGNGYESYDDCDTNNLAMHITATGSVDWGISFAGKLRLDGANVDLSAYEGVVFWARSSNNTSLAIGWTNEDNEVGYDETRVPPLGTNWKQFKVKFPAAADPSALSIVKLLGSAPSESEDLDIWIEDLTLYVEPLAE